MSGDGIRSYRQGFLCGFSIVVVTNVSPERTARMQVNLGAAIVKTVIRKDKCIRTASGDLAAYVERSDGHICRFDRQADCCRGGCKKPGKAIPFIGTNIVSVDRKKIINDKASVIRASQIRSIASAKRTTEINILLIKDHRLTRVPGIRSAA